jgi:NADH:ubiquinone oxidoreductase subunit 6 (subunit J)
MAWLFWLLAVVSVGAALAVVLNRDIFRAALFLVLCFFAIAIIYVTLNADFLAAVQVLIYIGAISVLLIFAILLTRGVQRGNPFNRLKFPALVITGLLLVTLVTVFSVTDWNSFDLLPGLGRVPVGESTLVADIGMGATLFDKVQGFILPFEIAAMLLLAAIIGAIVLVREK